MTQRDKMRELYRRYSGNKEAVIKAYSRAEFSGDVDRLRNASGFGTEQYARALWNDGEKKGWLTQSGAVSTIRQTNPELLSPLQPVLSAKSPAEYKDLPTDVNALLVSETPINVQEDSSALIIAASNGDTNAVRMLLDKGVDPNTVDRAGDTALVEAVWWGHEEIVQLLLDGGAMATYKHSNGKTLTDMAVENGRVEIVLLLERAKKNAYLKREKRGSLALDTNPRLKMLLKELNELIGLNSVKADVVKSLRLLDVQQKRKTYGLVAPEQHMHIVFTGNPGVGKTTVARLISQIYHAMGLTEGIFVETDRAGLVGGYLGQTALKTKKVIESAYGGVLFIDDAYRLTQDKQDSYGLEAVDTLLTEMENHRDELIVIVAGYEQEMETFLQSNDGLKSRFNKHLRFEDYTPDELTAIFSYFVEQYDYKITQATETKLDELFVSLYHQRIKGFGNARDVRNLFQKAISNHANRMALTQAHDEESLMTLHPEDIPNA